MSYERGHQVECDAERYCDVISFPSQRNCVRTSSFLCILRNIKSLVNKNYYILIISKEILIMRALFRI